MAAGARVLRCGAPRLLRLTSRSRGFCGAPRCAQRGWRSDVPAPHHNLLRGENDEERRPYSGFSQIAPRFPWTVFK